MVVGENLITYDLVLTISGHTAVSSIWTAFVATIFLSLAPFASFIADVKFGRFKILVTSSTGSWFIVCRFELDKKFSELVGCLAFDNSSNLSLSVDNHNIDT